jgi:hypothetical protein
MVAIVATNIVTEEGMIDHGMGSKKYKLTTMTVKLWA